MHVYLFIYFSFFFYYLFPHIDALSEFDILGGVIKIPPDDGVIFEEGSDGFSAIRIKSHADIKSPYKLILQEKVYEFSIMATIRAESKLGGYLFSVVNPIDTIVQLGIFLSPVVKDKWNISLVYTDVTIHQTSQKVATFEIPYVEKWTRYAFRVLHNEITFFLNCIEWKTVAVKREPSELIFDSASTLYLAQAGPLLNGHFEVSDFIFYNYIYFILFKYIQYSIKFAIIL